MENKTLFARWDLKNMFNATAVFSGPSDLPEILLTFLDEVRIGNVYVSTLNDSRLAALYYSFT